MPVCFREVLFVVDNAGTEHIQRFGRRLFAPLTHTQPSNRPPRTPMDPFLSGVTGHAACSRVYAVCVYLLHKQSLFAEEPTLLKTQVVLRT